VNKFSIAEYADTYLFICMGIVMVMVTRHLESSAEDLLIELLIEFSLCFSFIVIYFSSYLFFKVIGT
jgi:hypothetical protein